MKKRLFAIILSLALSLTCMAIPAYALVTTGSLKPQRETDHFTFYCVEQDIDALDDLEASFEGCYEQVTTDLGKSPSGKTRVNIYPDIKSFHAASSNPNPQDWSVGEARNGVVYMTSPLNPGSYHDYDNIITIAVHEYVHIVIEQFGRKQPSYLNEGVAAYEAGQNQSLKYNIQNDMAHNALPSLSKLASFSSTGSDANKIYTYGYVYVEFIITQFGHDKLIALLEGQNREKALGMSESELNEKWLAFVTANYGEQQPATPTQPTLPTVEDIAPTGTAVPTPQTVKLDGKDVVFQTYALKDEKGNSTNYVKIRDLANELNGTKAQFNVSWDGKISIIPNTAYVPNGSEGSTPYSGDQTYKSVSDIPVSFKDSDVKLTSLQIIHEGKGYTYYKLRDLGQLLDFETRWDSSAGCIVIETGKPYTGN